jgi:ADP-ribose pyrophosphatase
MSEKVHEVKTIYEGKIFDVALETVTLPNGAVKDREVVRHPGAAAMVPVFEDGKVALIRQYRHAVGRFLWEIPAGTLEAGEDALACAGRELAEETGYEAGRLEMLAQIFPAPGYTDECIRIYLATGLTPTKQQLEDDEVLELQTVPFATALEMIEDGRIEDAKTITGLLLTSMKHNRPR